MTITLPPNARGPILDLALPESAVAIDIILRNVTTGKQLAVNLPAAWGGDDLSLDFYRRTITDQTGADRSALLSASDNELWSTEPLITGVNDIEIEALAPMASVTKSPGTIANDAAAGTVDWANLNNAKASDNAYATATLFSSTSKYLKATNYGFALPASVVVGIRGNLERKGSAGNAIFDFAVRLVKAGTVQATDRKGAGFWPSAEAIRVYGGETDKWDGMLYTDINNAGFGWAVSATFPEAGELIASVDSMPLTVFYRPTIAYVAKATLRWEKGYY